MQTALHKAIELAGGVTAVAKALGITKQAVSQWEKCPPDKVLSLVKLVKRKVTASELRPDVFGT